MYDPKLVEQFNPTPQERDFVNKVWDQFKLMWWVRQQPLELLNGRTLQAFWDASNKDYAVYTQPADAGDPVTQYSSTISRDKADVFIANLTQQLMYPSVLAQNSDQKIDRIMSRVSRSLLEWAHNNDGYPSESGFQKMSRYIHKMVVEGTVHIKDDVSKDGLESSMVPNEEIFLQNYWQPDIQKQPVVIQAKLNLVYDEVEPVFGNLPNWKYVSPGFTDWWFVQRPTFKSQWEGILMYQKLQVIYVWINCTQKELADLKKQGRVPSYAKQAKYFNVLINNVPMYPVDNLSPYKDGLYPLSKGIFTEFAKSEFYWGNSMPNKVAQDKAWLDAWKTLIRYKAKLNVLPPMVSLNGVFVDEEILLPGKITPITDELSLKRIEGVADPISNADVQMMQMAENEIDRGSVSPRTGGQQGAKESARATVITETNAQKMFDSFSQKVAWLVQARSFPILMRLFQFLPRRSVKMIAIPDQTLKDGTKGTFEVIFEKLPDMTKEETLAKSIDILHGEIAAREEGSPKETAFVDTSYVKELNFLLKADASSGAMSKDEMKKQQFNQNMQLYLARPDLFNAKEVARKFVQYNDDDEDILNDQQAPEQQQQQPMMQGQPQQPGQPMRMSQLMPQNMSQTAPMQAAPGGGNLPQLNV